MEPQVWHTLIVRLWRDGDGLKVRFLAGRTGQEPTPLMLATSVESAVRQFERWLRSVDRQDDVPDGGEARPPGATPGTTQRRRNGRHLDDARATDGDTTRP